MAEHRPNPTRLLEQIQAEEKKEKRGKLKIYLGAAPGVGKTYEMLRDGLEERSGGLDIVVGVAESHGRQEIKDLLRHYEVSPKVDVEYRGIHLSDFDLDGALKRRPALMLIDEMAHTNAPGLRHKKRWQDIKELLDCGIDVYTTLNVQHIESLNNDVAQIIHAPVRETVPDSMIEMADTIELVDLPPEELLKRLEEGKVYFPQQAELAKELFFKKGNLIALRELALRITADRVGAQVLLYRQGLGIQQIWPTKEKILVFVGSGAESRKLIRKAKRIAAEFQAEWICVYVDRPHVQSSDEKRNLAIKNLRFAEELGAQTRVLTGFDIVKEVMTFARDQNITLIMIWKHIRNRWRNIFFRDLADEIVRFCREIDVYVVTGTQEELLKKQSRQIKKVIPWSAYAISLGVVFVATVIDYFFQPYIGSGSLIMVYLLAITIVALMGYTGPAIASPILSVVAYNYFFISPHLKGLGKIDYFFTLIVMLILSQVISQLTLMARLQAESARRIAHQTSTLYSLSRQLASARGTEKLLDIGTGYIADLFDAQVLALLPKKDQDHLVIRSKSRTTQDLDEKEQGIAQWVYELGQMAGLGTDSLSFSDALYLPLMASQEMIGVLRVRPSDPERLLEPEQLHLLEACANQVALAVSVDRLHRI